MDKQKINQTNYFRRTKDKVFIHYGKFCSCCGEKNEEFLTIDHVNNDGAAERKLHPTTNKMCLHIIKQNFPKKYQILCFNCNNGKRKTGVCPHQKVGISDSSAVTIN